MTCSSFPAFCDSPQSLRHGFMPRADWCSAPNMGRRSSHFFWVFSGACRMLFFVFCLLSPRHTPNHARAFCLSLQSPFYKTFDCPLLLCLRVPAATTLVACISLLKCVQPPFFFRMHFSLFPVLSRPRFIRAFLEAGIIFFQERRPSFFS